MNKMFCNSIFFYKQETAVKKTEKTEESEKESEESEEEEEEKPTLTVITRKRFYHEFCFVGYFVKLILL